MSASISRVTSVRHYVAGGREHGGGIGRLVGYVLDAPGKSLRHTVRDTRGPRLSLLGSPLCLAKCMAGLCTDRIRSVHTLHQLHVAGRGSTARKLLLGGAARLSGARYVLHLHDYDYAADYSRRPDWQKRAIRTLFRGAETVLVLGHRDRDTIAAFGVPADRIEVLRNCVPDPGARLRPAHETPHIVFLGQLGPRKGVPELIDAMASPEMAALSWRATLAGGGDVESYRDRIAAHGLTDRVALPGWLGEPETRALCTSADILVLPSHAEGFAMAVLEGLAHGLAVVTTPVGAHPEILEHDRHCLLIPPGDPPTLARALADLVADPARRAALGAEARKLFVEQFGIDGYVRRLEALQSGTDGVSVNVLRSA